MTALNENEKGTTPRDDTEPLVTLPADVDMRVQRSGKQPLLGGYVGALGALLAVVIVCATLMAVSSEVRRQVVISFVPQPERYTELYFSGNGPTEVRSHDGLVVVTIVFTVGNHEGGPNMYRYAVDAVNDGGAVLARVDGSVDVPDRKMLTITVALEISTTDSWSAVNVNLAGRGERIRFLRSEMKATAG